MTKVEEDKDKIARQIVKVLPSLMVRKPDGLYRYINGWTDGALARQYNKDNNPTPLLDPQELKRIRQDAGYFLRHRKARLPIKTLPRGQSSETRTFHERLNDLEARVTELENIATKPPETPEVPETKQLKLDLKEDSVSQKLSEMWRDVLEWGDE